MLMRNSITAACPRREPSSSFSVRLPPTLGNRTTAAAGKKDRRHNRLPPREVQRSLQTYREKAGLALRVTPHTLRRSFASKLTQTGATPYEVKELLGHRDESGVAGQVACSSWSSQKGGSSPHRLELF